MSQIPNAEQFTKIGKDAAYVTIGLGVLALQKLQVQRRELADWVTGQADEARTSIGTLQGQFGDRVKAVEERLAALEERVDSVLDEFQGRLPEQVRELTEQARAFTRQARAELFDLVGRSATRPGSSGKGKGKAA
ncbi:MAG: hypothetical protein ACRD29_19245 [Acidimicrobiales bacterium]